MKHLKTKTVYISFFLLFCLTGCSQKNSSATSLDIPDTTIETSDSDPFEPLTVHFLDVGQGDCTIITQGQHTMLIDAGQNHHGTKIQHYLNELGIDTLDYAILTHPDADHIGSADVILYKFDCEKIMMPDMKADTQTYEEVIQTLKEKNYTALSPDVGDSYSLGNASFTILSPAQDYPDANDNSIVIHLTHGENTFLFTGDAGYEAETDMLNTDFSLQADVLKAGHHGSSSSTSDAFLKAVSPSYAVISCGQDNDYGHPHIETLKRLLEADIMVYRTDELGTITATSDGVTLNWNTFSADTKMTYIVNARSGKIHLPDCENVDEMSEQNKDETGLTLGELLDMGYKPCGWCLP